MKIFGFVESFKSFRRNKQAERKSLREVAMKNKNEREDFPPKEEEDLGDTYWYEDVADFFLDLVEWIFN